MGKTRVHDRVHFIELPLTLYYVPPCVAYSTLLHMLLLLHKFVYTVVCIYYNYTAAFFLKFIQMLGLN